MVYVQDDDRLWSVNAVEGFAEPVGQSPFRENVPENEIIRYEGKIDDYLREQGYRDLEYKSGTIDKWYFASI